jgi:hypothetical protein
MRCCTIVSDILRYQHSGRVRAWCSTANLYTLRGVYIKRSCVLSCRYIIRAQQSPVDGGRGGGSPRGATAGPTAKQWACWRVDS